MRSSPTRASARRSCWATATPTLVDDDDDGDGPFARAASTGGDHARGTALQLDMERALAVLSDAETGRDRPVLP